MGGFQRGLAKKACVAACVVVGLAARPLLARALDPADGSGMGFLDVSSEPTGAEILIDDADLGQVTPQHHVPVRAGHHRLTLVTKEGAHKLTVGFSVSEGETRKLTLYLAQ